MKGSVIKVNNVEVFDEFEVMVKQVENITLTDREKLLVQMAIEHVVSCLTDVKNE